MDSTTLILIAAGLFVAWIIGPAIVLHYRLAVVPRRYEEIRDRFLSSNPGELLATQDERTKSGAWHYARLLHPNSMPTDPEKVIERQYWLFHGWGRYRLPLALVILLSGLMLAFSGLWLADRLSPRSASIDADQAANPPITTGTTNAATQPVNDTNAPAKPAKPLKGSTTSATDTAATGTVLGHIPAPFVMALWGAYVWSLYEILRRRQSGDLTPVELYDIASRYVTAIPIGYAFSLLVFDTVPALAAFAISAFPLRDILRFFRTYTLNKLDEKPQPSAPTVSKGYLGDTLCGVGNNTITRLEELNIETYLDLAYADPIKLLIKTGVPIELVLAWIDQAMVSVYAAPHKAALASYGMACALDLCEFYTRHCWDVDNNRRKDWQTDANAKAAVEALAAKLGIPSYFVVEHLLRSVFDDPHTKFLVRVWIGPPTKRGDM